MSEIRLKSENLHPLHLFLYMCPCNDLAQQVTITDKSLNIH